MNFENVARIVGKLGAVKYFPSDTDARLAVAEQLAEICHTEEQCNWLVKRYIALYPEWTGVHELRAVASSKFKPKDGIEAYSGSYPDGIPSEKPELPALPPAEAKQLTSGDTATASPSIAGTLSDLVRAKDMNRATRKQLPGEVREIPVLKLTDANRVTEADVKAAVQAVRDQKAREVIG